MKDGIEGDWAFRVLHHIDENKTVNYVNLVLIFYYIL